MTIAPAAERSPCASERPDNGSGFCRARAGKECDHHLLEASAPHPQIMDGVPVILSQDLGQQRDAFADAVTQQLFELRANPGRRY